MSSPESLMPWSASRRRSSRRGTGTCRSSTSTLRRRRGIGRALMDSVVAFAGQVAARCVWLETQDVNYPAVRFYRRLGVRLCRVDQWLYDPASPDGRTRCCFSPSISQPDAPSPGRTGASRTAFPH